MQDHLYYLELLFDCLRLYEKSLLFEFVPYSETKSTLS